MCLQLLKCMIRVDPVSRVESKRLVGQRELEIDIGDLTLYCLRKHDHIKVNFFLLHTNRLSIFSARYMCFKDHTIKTQFALKKKVCGRSHLHPHLTYIPETYHSAFLASLVAQTVKRLPAMWETWIQSLGWEDPLEKEMATHSSILAWRIPWTEEPDGLQSMRSQRVEQN